MNRLISKICALSLSLVLSVLPFLSNFTAAKAQEIVIDKTAVLEARFLNMLNHSYVYGENFESIESIVNNSVVALLNYRDVESFDYISQNIVSDYLSDMFGLELMDFSSVNPDFPKKEGFVYILPRGYSKYSHKAVSLTQNEDGTYLFETKVNIKTHDGMEENADCKTRFVKNPASEFGYNIVFSEIF